MVSSETSPPGRSIGLCSAGTLSDEVRTPNRSRSWTKVSQAAEPSTSPTVAALATTVVRLPGWTAGTPPRRRSTSA